MPVHHSVSFHLTSNSRDSNPVRNPNPHSQFLSEHHNRTAPAPSFEDRVYHGFGTSSVSADKADHRFVSADKAGHRFISADKADHRFVSADKAGHRFVSADKADHRFVSGRAAVRYDKHGCPLRPCEIGYQAPCWDKKRVTGLPTTDMLVMRRVEQVPDWYRRKADEKVKRKSGLRESFRKLFACFKIAT